MLVSHNVEHFVLLHDAWRLWSQAWQAAPQHAGILVLPGWPAVRVAQELDQFLRSGRPLANVSNVQ